MFFFCFALICRHYVVLRFFRGRVLSNFRKALYQPGACDQVTSPIPPMFT